MKNYEEFLQEEVSARLDITKIRDNKSFSEIFSIDNIPLFWFYKRYLLQHVLPKPLNTYPQLLKTTPLTASQKIKLSLTSLTMRKYLKLRERKKILHSKKDIQPTTAPKALFLTYPEHLREGNSLYRIQGIIDAYAQQNILEPFTLFATQLSSKKKIDANFNTIYQYCDPELIAQAQNTAVNLAKEWKNMPENTKERLFSYNNNTDYDYLNPAFSFLMSYEFLLTLCTYYLACKKIIQTQNIKVCFISGQNGIFERCLAAASKTKNIPCILVPHGFSIGNLPAQDVLTNMYLPVFNKTTASNFIKNGVPKGQIKVTGPAMYDNIINYLKKKHPERMVLLLTQPLIEDNMADKETYFQFLKEVLEQIIEIDNIQLTIKLHPREQYLETYLELVDKLQKNKKLNQKKITVVQNGNNDTLYSLLSKTSVALNFNATAGILEASILDIPSINFPYNKQKSPKYGPFDPSIYVFDIKQLKQTIEQCLSNPKINQKKRKAMVKEYCTYLDGKSSQRIVEWTYQLLHLNVPKNKY